MQGIRSSCPCILRYSKMSKTDLKQMEVYKEKCIGGGKCARVCPREAITSDYKSKHNKSPCNLDGDRNGEHPCFARLHRFC